MSLSRREALLTMAAPAVLPGGVPEVDFGGHKVSRLIVGGNPVSGNSHVSNALDREMADYYTADNVKKLLRNCELAGINTWQSRGDRHIMRLLREYRNEGGRIQWIGQTASELADVPRNINDMAAMGAIGIYHHGSRTDKAWVAGQIGQVHDMLKVMRQAGVRVGLGTHIPEVVDYVEDKGWDLDFYMTCVYNLTRAPEESSRIAGRTITGEFFHEPDRARMLERVRRTSKQCLIFKIYGATRQCGSAEARKAAVDLVFDSAKPGDAVVVGMFPKRSEQVEENCRLVADSIARRPV